jgi:hypothetical protein
MSDLAALVNEARQHLDRLDGTLLPEFTRVPDGLYTTRVVFDGPGVARFVEPGDAPDAPAFQYEPCRVPRFRTDVRWVPGYLEAS